MWPIWENVHSNELSTSYFAVPRTCSMNSAIDEAEASTRLCRRVVATPSSIRRVAWDLLCFAIMGGAAPDSQKAISDAESTIPAGMVDVNRFRTRSSSSNTSEGILIKARFSANDHLSSSCVAQMDALKTPEPQVRHHASVKSHSCSDTTPCWSTVVGRVKMWPIWENVHSNELSTSYFAVPRTCSMNSAIDEAEASTRLCRRVVATPSSIRRVAWDLLCFAIMGYDILYIPLQDTGFGTTSLVLGLCNPKPDSPPGWPVCAQRSVQLGRPAGRPAGVWCKPGV